MDKDSMRGIWKMRFNRTYRIDTRYLNEVSDAGNLFLG